MFQEKFCNLMTSLLRYLRVILSKIRSGIEVAPISTYR